MTMKLIITREILEQFPGATVGVVIAAGIDNAREHPEIGELLQGEEARVRTELQGAMLTELPQIAAWRQAYRKFGAKPKKHASSIESLLQRISNLRQTYLLLMGRFQGTLQNQ